MKLTTKLTALFLLLSIVPLAVVGYLAFDNGRRAIEQDALNHLTATTILKEDEFNRWVRGNERLLRALARRPLVQEYAAMLASGDQADPGYQAAYRSFLEDHLTPTLEDEGGFLDLFILRGDDGLVFIATDEKLEGRYKESQPYFMEGQSGTYVQNVYYSLILEEAAMTIATPIVDREGNLIAVLAGHVDLTEMSAIMAQSRGLSATEETYLVNSFNFFVTESRFEPGYALKKAVYTEGVVDCLAGNDGVGLYDGYRDVPVIGAYRWMPDRELCILTEVDQSEAFAPIVALRNTVLVIGVGVALVVAVLGVFFARTITKPVYQLVRGAGEIGKGNLEYRIEVGARDEIGQLSEAFNQMTENLIAITASRDELNREITERVRAEERAEHLNRVLRAIRNVNQLITREKNRDRLLQGVCNNLVETRGYYNAWVAFLDEAGRYAASAEAGLGENFLPMVERLERGELPECGQRALAQPDVAITEDPLSTCIDCPLAGEYGGRGAATVRLEYEGKVYGLLAASVHRGLIADKEERTLFGEVAEDIAFALYSMELEEERKQAEEALKEYSKQLEERTQELHDAQEELVRQEKLAVLGQLAGGVGHELRNPLGAISNAVYFLNMALEESEPDVKETLAILEMEVTNSERIISDLLSFARAKSPARRKVDLNDVVEEALARTAVPENVEVASHLDEALPVILADPDQLGQIFENIILNAIQAMPEGGQLVVKSEALSLEDVAVSFADTGEGIPKENLDKLFEPLFTTKAKGIGLGLAITKTLVERHGGAIELESEIGTGSTFTVRLPTGRGKAK